jgi:hypothetical protein
VAFVSYDLSLCDPVTGVELELDAPHHMRGGTYALGGSAGASLNVTYNYSSHFYRVMDKGIRGLYGLTGAQSIPVLDKAIGLLGDDVDGNYWNGTEGNAKRALKQLRALAQMRPDGVWRGD